LALPSMPSIILDKNGVVTSWNKKAEEFFGLTEEQAIGTNVTDLELMKDEKFAGAKDQCQENKQTVSVKSVYIRNQHDEGRLMDISHTPILDSNGEFKGSIMLLEDVSEVAEIQAKFERKQEELESLSNKYQDAFKKLSLIDKEIEVTNEELRQKKLELEEKKNSIEELNVELNNSPSVALNQVLLLERW